MNSGHLNDYRYSYLDRIRINEGADKCRAALNEVFRKDPSRAVALLNDHGLMFPCLYILREQMERPRIKRYLNQRNMIAMRITDEIRGSGAFEADYLSSKRDLVYPVLKWLLVTGTVEEIPEDDYEEIIDVAVSVLINTYRDRSVLPQVADLIFKRNRNGRYIYDLVWALFQVHDPRVLRLIVEHIRSSDARDAELAAELLNMDETDVPVNEGDKEKRYQSYLRWLEENDPYLYFTEESFQYANRPSFSAIDLERKYLQEGTPSYDKQPIVPAGQDENHILEEFQHLCDEEKRILSEYSKKIHDKNVLAWKEWLHAPVGRQIKAAKDGSEADK